MPSHLWFAMRMVYSSTVSDKLLTSFVNKFFASMKRSIGVLNIVEKKYGFPCTIMYPAPNFYREGWLKKAIKKQPAPIKYSPACIFKASHRWIKTPSMVSLLGLCLRAFSCYPVFAKATDYNSLVNIINKSIIRHDDIKWLKESLELWPILIGKYKNLFRGFHTKDLWLTDASWLHDYMGISWLSKIRDFEDVEYETADVGACEEYEKFLKRFVRMRTKETGRVINSK
jgi:hypothetical protein